MRFLLKPFVVIGVLLLLTGIIAWKTPAGWLVTKAKLAPYDIQYDRASGTLWEGEAKGVSWRNLLLGDIQWGFMTLDQLSPPFTTWQFAGKGLDYHLSLLADVEQLSLRRMRFINGELPAGWVDLSKVVPLLFLGGRLNINLDYLELKRGPRGMAEGSIQWKDAAFKGLFEEKLGDIIINIEWVDGVTHVYFHSTQVRNIMLEGEANLTARRYNATLILHTTEKKRYVIEKLAKHGKIHPDGSLHITVAGNMPR